MKTQLAYNSADEVWHGQLGMNAAIPGHITTNCNWLGEQLQKN